MSDRLKCPASGKDRLTRKEAMRRAAWFRAARLSRMQHYYCGRCDSWHVGHNNRKNKVRR